MSKDISMGHKHAVVQHVHVLERHIRQMLLLWFMRQIEVPMAPGWGLAC